MWGELVIESGNYNFNPGTQRSVLLMCRSGNTLGALASILSRAGSPALTAQSAGDAWEIMRSGAVGCVVQDLTNITGDAFALFRTCRTSRNTFSVPFLFLTTADFKVPEFEGVWPETVRDGWLVLPCPGQQFLSSVRGLLHANLPTGPQVNHPGFHMPLQPQNNDSLYETQAPRRMSAVHGDPSASSKRMAAMESSQTANTLFSGKLGTLNFSQILGIIEPLHLTGTLDLFDGVRVGHVHFVDGKVFHAGLNEIEGSEALFLLFHLNTGSFQFDVGPATTKRTVEGTTMSLLLEGMRKMDEAKAMVSAIKERGATGRYAPVVARNAS